MGAFRYCPCGSGLDKPTAREDLTHGQQCCSCGRTLERYMTEAEWIIDLDDQLRDIESRLPKT